AQATQQQSILSQVKAQQETLHQQVKADVAATLVKYDHQIARIDDDFTQRLQGLEDRIDGLARQWEQSRTKIDLLLDRAENLIGEPETAAAQRPVEVDVIAESAAETVAVAAEVPPVVDPHAGATVAPPTVVDPVFGAEPAAETTAQNIVANLDG